MLQDLIPISEENGKQAVNARHLHAFLESKQRFADWIKDRIEKYGLIENQDYVVVNVLSNIDDQKYDIFDKKDTVINLRSGINQRVSAGGSNKKEYALTLDCAKELAMVEGNERGKEARQYFIEKEKQLRHVVKHLSQFEIMQQSLNVLMEQEKRVALIEKDVLELKAKTITRPECYTIAGYGALNKISVGLPLAASLGRKAMKICREKGLHVDTTHDPRFGNVGVYPVMVLQEVFNQSLF